MKGHLPIYGVGPFYGIGVILLTVISIIISVMGLLNSGMLHNTILVMVFITLGVLVIIGGWKSAAFGKGNIDERVKHSLYNWNI